VAFGLPFLPGFLILLNRLLDPPALCAIQRPAVSAALGLFCLPTPIAESAGGRVVKENVPAVTAVGLFGRSASAHFFVRSDLAGQKAVLMEGGAEVLEMVNHDRPPPTSRLEPH
jgi:hypothetical protein